MDAINMFLMADCVRKQKTRFMEARLFPEILDCAEFGPWFNMPEEKETPDIAIEFDKHVLGCRDASSFCQCVRTARDPKTIVKAIELYRSFTVGGLPLVSGEYLVVANSGEVLQQDASGSPKFVVERTKQIDVLKHVFVFEHKNTTNDTKKKISGTFRHKTTEKYLFASDGTDGDGDVSFSDSSVTWDLDNPVNDQLDWNVKDSDGHVHIGRGPRYLIFDDQSVKVHADAADLLGVNLKEDYINEYKLVPAVVYLAPTRVSAMEYFLQHILKFSESSAHGVCEKSFHEKDVSDVRECMQHLVAKSYSSIKEQLLSGLKRLWYFEDMVTAYGSGMEDGTGGIKEKLKDTSWLSFATSRIKYFSEDATRFDGQLLHLYISEIEKLKLEVVHDESPYILGAIAKLLEGRCASRVLTGNELAIAVSQYSRGLDKQNCESTEKYGIFSWEALDSLSWLVHREMSCKASNASGFNFCMEGHGCRGQNMPRNPAIKGAIFILATASVSPISGALLQYSASLAVAGYAWQSAAMFGLTGAWIAMPDPLFGAGVSTLLGTEIGRTCGCQENLCIKGDGAFGCRMQARWAGLYNYVPPPNMKCVWDEDAKDCALTMCATEDLEFDDSSAKQSKLYGKVGMHDDQWFNCPSVQENEFYVPLVLRRKLPDGQENTHVNRANFLNSVYKLDNQKGSVFDGDGENSKAEDIKAIVGAVLGKDDDNETDEEKLVRMETEKQFESLKNSSHDMMALMINKSRVIRVG
eukprot:TRINITY_DN29163_c0_g2_i1.p1 TRINITY_DN29163_c0_g2~~TRINITY_DN29163_c0_g2_i1.p1  ORF type:complete len:815 (-),score=49.25 TRINITY_DN29163_c0_g2_i1:78-2330(-)